MKRLFASFLTIALACVSRESDADPSVRKGKDEYEELVKAAIHSIQSRRLEDFGPDHICYDSVATVADCVNSAGMNDYNMRRCAECGYVGCDINCGTIFDCLYANSCRDCDDKSGEFA